ncbi:MAG TPA: glycoside hydrolase family 38 C-terminal domain-containing protein [Planctomycetota bacterium]|nr:glycoside hydrolase family 38 C-terminal domain-containing protein [Planctomycetota bacterium]
MARKSSADTPKSLKSILELASGEARAELERFLAEEEFARGLCELHPREATGWKRLLSRARELVAKAVEGGSAASLQRAVREAEKLLAPVGRAARGCTVHLVGHAHIDMNWMWGWPETVAVTNDTFGTVLRLMDEYPEFRFSQSQASVYAIIEQHNPEMLARIKRRVAEGRWEVTASHWVEGDKNLAGGEALCRHLLYTRRYMQELFGLKPEDVNIDWSPDTFGHAATVPSYLVRGGVKYLYLHRPGIYLKSKPGAFWWKAPDGSRVLVRNDMKLGYNGTIGPGIVPHCLAFLRETGARDWMFVYGVGDHGGGPTRRDILRGLDMADWPVFPKVEFSTARAFYQRLEAQGAKLPTLDTELNTEFAGCYTTQTLIKKDNRFAECKLADAEAAAALAWAALGRDYPGAAFTEGWRDTLFSHFHDILPGSGVHDTRTYTHGLFQKTAAATGMIETQALRALAAAVDTSAAKAGDLSGTPAPMVASGLGAGVGFASADGRIDASEQSSGQGDRPFVIWNPSSWERREVVEATVWDNCPKNVGTALKDRSFAVRGPDGVVRPAQKVKSGDYWGHQYVAVAFPVEVPALGYALYTVFEGEAPAAGDAVRQTGEVHHCTYARNERAREGLENDLIRMELDPATGGIRSLVEKASGAELVSPERPAPALEFAVERPHGMSAWCIENAGPPEPVQALAMRRKLSGPHRASLEVDLAVRQSKFTLTYELRAGDPRLHIHLAGVWFERGTPETGVPALALALPLDLADAKARYEIPFGAVGRDLNRREELPALNWAMVTGRSRRGRAGVVLANDSKHGHSLDGSTLRLTLIRSSYDPDILPEIGEHQVRLMLLPFAGALADSRAVRAGGELNHPLRTVGTDVHKGKLPEKAALLSVEPANVVLSGFKKAEDSDSLVVRVYETAGRKTTARLRFDRQVLGAAAGAAETDVLERPLGKSSAKKAGADAVTVAVPAHGIATVVVKLKR